MESRAEILALGPISKRSSVASMRLVAARAGLVMASARGRRCVVFMVVLVGNWGFGLVLRGLRGGSKNVARMGYLRIGGKE